MIVNRAASVRARLKQQADAKSEAFDLILTRFALERLLYRLSVSPHAGDFLLKGALLFSLWFEHPHRATRDADLLGFGSSELTAVEQKFREIVGVAFDDGIQFATESVTATEIRKQDGYGGVRVDIEASLDGARISVQVDIGFGDVVTPAAERVTYPALLDGFPTPKLRAYPRYTVIAEKLHAICLLGMTNSRMKDYFDLLVLSQETSIDTDILATAISATFERRKTPSLPDGLPVGLTEVFAKDAAKLRQWRAFVARNQLDAPSLPECIVRLQTFLASPIDRARAIGVRT